MKVYLDKMAFLPERAHEDDAGMDLRTRYDVTIQPGTFVRIDVGVHVQIPAGYYGQIAGRSSLACRGIFPIGGVVDSGYTGSVSVVLLNAGDAEAIFHAGDKIAQMIVIRQLGVMPEQSSHALEATRRGDNGFGSTGS